MKLLEIPKGRLCNSKKKKIFKMKLLEIPFIDKILVHICFMTMVAIEMSLCVYYVIIMIMASVMGKICCQKVKKKALNNRAFA